ncbi:M28 family peptidase [Aliikangiella sp. G2MR2-5]|uniref:M28 family peptidase n=1 Tax=Aliikangiella sp. G2MR2-5 TaxID=2788943 RepID=UPI0018ABA43F|nr:M28 family peptidase [Aliikangiella sp. G2MR2-5]
MIFQFNNLFNVLKFSFCAICLLLSACAQKQAFCPKPEKAVKNFHAQKSIDQQALLTDLKRLSSREMAGRATETRGNKLAANYIASKFQALNIQSYTPDYRHPFLFGSANKRQGVNLIGYIPGQNTDNRKTIVVTAHYDHLGTQGKHIFYGADDNASGVSAMLALARYWRQYPPLNNILFLATDAEEDGLYGSKHFVKNPPIALEEIMLNINLDMVARGGAKKRLYFAGTRKNKMIGELLAPHLSTARVCVRAGHETRSSLLIAGRQGPDWNNASDHAPFRKEGIPYIYFGVDVHGDYHQTSDTFENIDPEFFVNSVQTIVNFSVVLDQKLEQLSSIEN